MLTTAHAEKGGTDITRDRYQPVPLNIEGTRKRCSKDPAFAKACDAPGDEFAALGEPVRARQLAETSQADIATSMGIAQASVAQLGSSVGSRKHAPSIATLRRHADAIGCDLHIMLSPKSGASRRSVTRSEEPVNFIER